MPLTDDQNKKIGRWMADKMMKGGTARPCGACGTVSRRGVHDELIFAGSLNNADAGLLLVAVECDQCGAHEFFNAKTLGVAP